ncbi:hypothetical protein [Ectobacillus panaciterrae]|uniref:hypothetical protein n=1 Tax=Ectobacillus panaciterrae TaxID=363872 RepID=UPI0003FD6FD7|nr:hypothetical protein [Ectobacillus panaciterrae]
MELHDSIDPIYKGIQQQGTYASITVDLYQMVYEISSFQLKHIPKEDFFCYRRRKHWNAGMLKNPLTDIVGSGIKNKDEYVIFSFQKNSQVHKNANNSDTEEKFISLVKEWQVFLL